MARNHLASIAKVCRDWNCFLFIRPSEPATVRLIEQGFATKSMDIHEKSSDWGLHAGLVPQDPALSKTASPAVMPKQDVTPQRHGLAESVQLAFTAQQLATLSAANHFEHTTELTVSSLCPVGWKAGYRHFHSTRMPGICLLLDERTRAVSWAARAGGDPVPLYVKAYQGVPVTGDYDMWMVAPDFRWLTGEEEVHSNQDEHGRSASLRYTQRLAAALNVACRTAYPGCKDVFNHGAEAQNLSFTQDMEKKDLVVFCPGAHEPFLIHALNETETLTGVFHDLLRHGYVVMLNPKWKHGFTLGAEDLAFAPDVWKVFEPGLDAAIQGNRDKVRTLAEGAATTIQRAFRAKKHNEEILASPFRKAVLAAAPGLTLPRAKDPETQAQKAFKERAAKLLQFRKVAAIPADAGRDLVLERDFFPVGWRIAIPQDLWSRVVAATQEAGFKRTHFELEGERGHRSIMPVDETGAAEEDVEFYRTLYGDEKWAMMMVLAERRRAAVARRPR